MVEPLVTLIGKSKPPAGLRKFPVKVMPFATPGVSAVVPVLVSTRSSAVSAPSGTSLRGDRMREEAEDRKRRRRIVR